MTIPGPIVHFLLVDDLEENLLSLEALLKRDGLNLLKARSGAEALELLLEHEVALALLDVQMPGMDGFELAELMRGIDRTRRVPIIFLTAGGTDRRRRFRGYEAGAVDYLEKPIEPDILRTKADVFFELYLQRERVSIQRDELRIASEALKEVDKRKDEFLATLAHELRNPLAPIRNGLQILRMSPHGEKSAEVRDMMDRQLNHLIRLIDDLLDLSRVNQGKITLKKEPVTVQTVITSALEASEEIIKLRKHKINVDVTARELWIDGDFTRLAQIVNNLLNNAAKYTPDGGEIKLSVDEKDGNAIISVSDNGLGIPDDMLAKIFEMFTQVQNGQQQSQGGLGIGLALVKQLVEMHGGAISASSKGPNQGSSFTVRLPLAQGDSKQAPAASDVVQNAATTTTLRVLVVDDNISSAKTTGWTLEMMGHVPHLEHDGKHALEAAYKLLPDAILLDIGLPDMTGYDVCRELRKNPQFRDTVIIAQTGWGRESDRKAASEAGFDHHLVKPVNFDDFSQVVATIKANKASAQRSA